MKRSSENWSLFGNVAFKHHFLWWLIESSSYAKFSQEVLDVFVSFFHAYTDESDDNFHENYDVKNIIPSAQLCAQLPQVTNLSLLYLSNVIVLVAKRNIDDNNTMLDDNMDNDTPLTYFHRIFPKTNLYSVQSTGISINTATRILNNL